MIREAWYAAGWSHELASRPLRRKILGRKIELFRDASGTAHAESNHIVESQGVLWIWGAEDPPKASHPRYEFWNEPHRTKRTFSTPRLLPASFVQVAEQAIDTTHTPFVHRVSVGPDQERLSTPCRLEVDADERGLTRRDDTPPPSGKSLFRTWVQRRVLGIEAVSRHFRFELGGMGYLHVVHANGGWDATIFQMTPADDDHTWFFGETVRTHSRDPFSGYLHRRWLERVVEEDSGLHFLRKDSGHELPAISVEADAVTLAFRKLYRRWADA